MSRRIIIRAHTARRDTASSVLVARALQRAGFEVFVCSVRNLHWVVKYWKPHVIIVQTTGAAAQARELDREARIVFLDAEGIQPEDNSWATFWSKNPDYYDVLDRALLWGPHLVEEMSRLMGNQDLSKVRVVGSPKFDLLGYVRDNLMPETPSLSVGIVGRYPSINNHEGRPTIRGLHSKSNVEFTVSSCHAYHVQHQIMRRLLDETEYSISLRPHPLENIDNYHRYVIPSLGKQHAHRLSIDDRLDVAEWMSEQRALVSPTSTSYIEAFQLGVPFIIVDGISGMYEYNAGYADVCREWLESAFVPKTLEAAINLIIEAPTLDTSSPIMDNQLAQHCGLPSTEPATSRIVNAIVELLDEQPASLRKGLAAPERLLRLVDEFAFRRAMRRNPMHANFHYKKGFHQPPTYIDAVLDQVDLAARARA